MDGRAAAGLVLSLVLWGALAFGTLTVGFLALFFGMLSDGCYEGVDDGICSDAGGAIFFGAVLAFWAVLAFSLIGSLVMIVLSHKRRRRAWPWPLGAALVDVVAIVLFLVVVASLSPS
ncbi:MAG: hypothetical protein EON52_10420 [Actinomycetales bacterium]|nr:MAG: hypothetical protein EON52_10420 [Actinomycetales bacterium]